MKPAMSALVTGATSPANSSLDGNGLTATLLAGAALLLGAAMQAGNGTLVPGALALLTWALLCCGGAVVAWRWHLPLPSWGDRPAVVILGLGLAWQVATLVSHAPGSYLRMGPGVSPADFGIGLVLASLFIGAVLAHRPWLGALSFLALIGIHFYLGLWLLRASPEPAIDVFIVHREALNALLHGHNPYAIDFPNIYSDPTQFFAEGVVVNGRVQVGYLYPPLSLLWGLPGHLIAGDYRYSNLVAMEGTGLLLGFTRAGRLAKVAAATLLFTPRIFFILEQGWTEAQVVFLFALVVYLAANRPRVLPYALGALLFSKQYLVFTLAFSQLLWGRPWVWNVHVRRLCTALAVAGAIALPFFFWSPRAFLHSVVEFQLKQPFRTDALSYLSEWAARYGTHLPSWIGFVAALLALVFVLRLGHWSPAGFAVGSALIYGVFFAFNKQAFCNYYYFVLGTVCCALAALPVLAPAPDLE